MNDRVSEELLAAAARGNADEVMARVSVPELNFLYFIRADGERLTTTSQQVAMAFGKHHKNVMRDIRALIDQIPEEDRLLNFEPTVEMRPNPSGGESIASPGFAMSRDGFTLLAMGFTGKRALGFKIAYIKAFNAMAAYIKNQRDGLRYRCMELELEDKDSKRRGSYHAKGLNLRKREKKVIDPELADLKDKVQPKLV
ncbi:hypothetical protein GJ698_02395 [Pseudoduganella sp. FT26W]|uniref:Rha family transcriptional regulator n=1 Tax=Duganella aquatilis TaxID=2666082 RepID=A0A844D607_9BURK|nr:Rha family transcriptional regulator [Duganella aquatilis]MRW82940.1 hypothetical protein [Duganella aquatilis]